MLTDNVILASGGVAYRFGSDGSIEVLLVGSSGNGEWRLPKGIKRDESEEIEETARREVGEEAGVVVDVEDYICSSHWDYEYEGSQCHKIVFWFLLRPIGEIEKGPIAEYDLAQWTPIERARAYLTYASEKTVVDSAQQRINGTRKPFQAGTGNIQPLQSEVVYRGARIKVQNQVFRLQNGIELTVESIDFPDIAIIVPIVDNQVVFVRQYRYALSKFILELPAGILKSGESPEGCAIRELAEETGYICKQAAKLGTMHVSPHLSGETTHIFLATNLQLTKPNLEPTEIIDVVKMDIGLVRQMISAGELTDAKSLVALSLAFF